MRCSLPAARPTPATNQRVAVPYMTVSHAGLGCARRFSGDKRPTGRLGRRRLECPNRTPAIGSHGSRVEDNRGPRRDRPTAQKSKPVGKSQIGAAAKAKNASIAVRSVFGSNTGGAWGRRPVEGPLSPQDRAQARHGLVGGFDAHIGSEALTNHLGVLFTRRSNASRNAIFRTAKLWAVSGGLPTSR